MAYQTIEVRKLTPGIGAEIFGVDLARPLGNQQFQEVHDALMENLVIFFRDQELTHEQHKDFGRRFGELHIIRPRRARTGSIPRSWSSRPTRIRRYVAGEEWHSDVSLRSRAADGQHPLHEGAAARQRRQHAVRQHVPRLRDALAPMQRLCEGLTAVHDGAQVYGGRFGQKPKEGGFPRNEHPVVRTHPVTGRKALYVNRNFTTGIVGLQQDTRATRCSRCSSSHCETPEFQCRFAWRPTRSPSGTTARPCIMRCGTTFPHRRLGYRVTVKGDKPFYRS